MKNIKYYDEIDNLSLIENGLLHIEFELSRKTSSYFRIARESHRILYCAMIEVLKGTSNIPVTGKLPTDTERIYTRGNGIWKKIKRIKIKECEKAWRFSEPEECSEPKNEKLEAENNDKSLGNNLQEKQKEYLIPYYEALAKIQTECYMDQNVRSKAFLISDEDMKMYEWLHEEIRNNYEHFFPSTHLSPISDLCLSAKLCLTLSKDLLFKSANVFFHDNNQDELNSLFDDTLKKFNCI